MYLKETSELASSMPSNPFRNHFLPGLVPFEHVNDGITVSAVEQPQITNGIICQPTPKVNNFKENYKNYCFNNSIFTPTS